MTKVDLLHNLRMKFNELSLREYLIVEETTNELEQAFATGLEVKGPQWHDLRKTPNDLPKDTTSLYLVRVYSWDFGLSHLYEKYGMYIPTVCEWSGEHFKALNDMAYSNARNIKSCIDWCEIPAFDKE